MAIAEKLTKIAENMQAVYEAGKAAAVLSGTVSFTDATKTLTIEGLPAAPKQVNIYSITAISPTDENLYFIRGLDYDADGFYFGGGTVKMLACLWLAVPNTISETAAANGSINEKANKNYNIFSYDNGRFTIQLQSNNKYHFGENYTYRWTAVF